MGDPDTALPPSKKRIAGRELSRDNPDPDDEEAPEQEAGTFQRASEEVLAQRKIVKVRRHQPQSSASSNPFTGICLAPPTGSSTQTTSTTVQSPVTDDKATKGEVSSTAVRDKTEDKGTEKGAAANELNGTDESDETGGQGNETANKEKSSAEESTVPEEGDQNAECGEETKDEAKAEDNGHKGTVAAAVPFSFNPLSSGQSAFMGLAGTGFSFGTGTAKKEEKSSAEESKVPEEGDKNAECGEETKDEAKEDNGHKNTAAAPASFSSFKQLSSSQNAFTGLAGTGFSSSSFSFGTVKDGTSFPFGLKNDTSSFPSFGFGNPNNGSSVVQLFSTSASDATKRGGNGLPSMQVVPIETGEENEKVLFTADAVLFEYLDGGWKERGKGELKVNVSSTGPERARLVMRARGNYRLILNANLYPDMKLTNMDKRGITFSCVNSTGEGKDGFATFALKFKDSAIVDEFRETVNANKEKNTSSLKTPENSPKASDD